MMRIFFQSERELPVRILVHPASPPLHGSAPAAGKRELLRPWAKAPLPPRSLPRLVGGVSASYLAQATCLHFS